ncbi:MAG: O-antigen ligase domain-containing protein, partial [Moorea sp. SIO2C4]|nr:O-antigen ligase domain-containing protein [Moorena sp. SIO2C4]
MKPQNFEEKVVFYYIISTYLLFFLGAQFVFAPALAWLLTFYLIKKLWQQTSDTPPEERIRIPIGVWVWIVCISVIGLALVVGHLDWGFSTVKTIKSFINSFLRTWALLALFPLIGCLNIRPQIIYRAISILSLQTLILVPI